VSLTPTLVNSITSIVMMETPALMISVLIEKVSMRLEIFSKIGKNRISSGRSFWPGLIIIFEGRIDQLGPSLFAAILNFFF